MVNLPSGEVDSGVVPGSGNGTVVVDCSFGEYRMEREMLEIEIENGIVRKFSGHFAEEKKVFGTARLGIGNDLHYGGTNNVPIHIDGFFPRPTVRADGIVIIEKSDHLYRVS